MTTTEAHNPFTCLDVACAPCHGLQEETMDTRPNPDADDIVES